MEQSGILCHESYVDTMGLYDIYNPPPPDPYPAGLKGRLDLVMGSFGSNKTTLISNEMMN